MNNYLITIEYDGSEFVGWQRQKNGISVQETIEKKIQKILKTKVKLIGSGRTDKGVHAIAQSANFLTLKKGYSKFRSYFLAIFISFLFIGLWHKISLNFLFFAIISSSILLIERAFLDDYIKEFSKRNKYKIALNIYAQITFIIAVSPCINNLKNILIKP